MKTQLHFINEDYDWMPDLLIGFVVSSKLKL